MRVRSLWKGILSAAIAGVIVWAIFMLQLRQLEDKQTVRVLAPSAFIPAGTLLTEDLLAWRPIEKGAAAPDMITRLEEALEMENIVPLGKNEPLLRWKLDKFMKLPSMNEATFRIPKEYVLSVASGIRAGDRVAVYVTGPEEVSRRLFAHAVKVASVKTASGLEVDGAKVSHLAAGAGEDRERMYAARLDDNGIIDHINLNLTEEEWLMLDSMCKAGAAKLVVALTPIIEQGGKL